RANHHRSKGGTGARRGSRRHDQRGLPVKDHTQLNTNPAVDSEKVFSARRRIVLIGGVAPVLIALTTTLSALTWMPELPDPVAVHWGTEGVDGYGSAWIAIILPLAITLAFAVFAVLSSWKVAPDGRLLSGQKLVV